MAQWLWRANHCSKRPRRPHTCRVSAALYVSSSSWTRRAVAGADRSSACVVPPTSRTFHYRDDRTFEQDVGADCSNSCVARYLSTISRATQSSAVPFLERSRVCAGNYMVDAVFSHTHFRYKLYISTHCYGRVSILCGMWNAEFRQRIICGISDVEKNFLNSVYFAVWLKL